MTVQQAFENFIRSRKLSGCTEKTIECYKSFCKPFIAFVGADSDISSLNHHLYNAYIETLYERPIAQSTRATYVRHFKAFVRWVGDDYDLDLEYKKIKTIKTPKKIVHIYSLEEIQLIFSSIDIETEWIRIRNQCIIALMLDSGLRRSEVCAIQRVDIDNYTNTLKIHGKGNKERLVPIGKFSQNLMQHYEALCPHHQTSFFVNIHGDPLTNNAVKQFMSKLGRKLPFEFSAHKLRHNFATNYCIDHLEKNGQVDIYALMILMGHEDVNTTERYLHFARQIIASRNTISHLDKLLLS